MAEPVEQRYPLARRSVDALIAVGVPEATSSGTYPILFYTSTAERGLKQVTINNQGVVGIEDARSADRKAKGFIEISGPVEVVALNGQKVTVIAQPKSAVHLHDETVSLEFPTAEATRKISFPYDLLLDGLIDGHHIAKYRVAGVDQYRIVHSLVIPQAKEGQVVERKGGAHVQTESETPNFILVFNPQSTRGGIDWAMSSTRDFMQFEQSGLIELLNCLDKTDPRRTSPKAILEQYLKDQALVGLEKEVSRSASPITSEPILAALREFLPRRVATQDLTVRQTELPLVDRQGEFRVGDQVIVIHDPKVREDIERARIQFQEIVSGLFVDERVFDEKIIGQETAILEATRRHEKEDILTTAELGFPVIAGYHYLTEGLRKIMDEYNAEVERVLQTTFYNPVRVGVLTELAFVTDAESNVARQQAVVAASKAVLDRAIKELDIYSPSLIEKVFRNKREQLEKKYNDAQKKARLDKEKLGTQETQARVIGALVSELIIDHMQDIADFFAAANPSGKAQRLAVYQDRLRGINGQLPKVRIRPMREGERERIDALDKDRAKVEEKIKRENNPPAEIVRLHALKSAVEAITKGMDQYVERAENEGDEDYAYPYTGDILKADLVCMDDATAQKLMVISAYLAHYNLQPSVGMDNIIIPNFTQYPPTPSEMNKLGIPKKFGAFLEREDTAGPYQTREGKHRTGRANYAVAKWLQNSQFANEGSNSPRAVLREEVFDNQSEWLITYDHPDNVRKLLMSRQAWMMEAISEVAYMSLFDLHNQDVAENMRILRGKNLCLPPLGMILSQIPRKEIPVFALALRTVINNGGFTFASGAACIDMGRDNMAGSFNKYLYRNYILAGNAEYLVQQVRGLLPNIETEELNINLIRMGSQYHTGKAPKEAWRTIKDRIGKDMIPVGVA